MAASIVISALGMVTSLGLDLATSCAAARAGLARARELDYFTLWSPVNGEITPAKGHQIPQITEGFEGDARLARILSAALRDFLQKQERIDWKSSRLGTYAALPDPYRIWRGSERVADQEIRESFVEAARSIPKDNTELNQAQRLIKMAFQTNGMTTIPRLRWVSRAGNCGVSECIIQASEDIAQQRIEQAVIFAADSLLEESTLAWLKHTGRLKSPAVATGLAPGEAGVVVGLKATDKNEKSTKSIVISATNRSSEENSLLSGKPVLGRAMADLLKALPDDCLPGWIVCDQNGEDYRAMEWGYALVRNKFDVLSMSYPAISFGDTGAASGGVSIATIVHALNRNCAPARKAIVLSASESTERTCVVVERRETIK